MILLRIKLWRTGRSRIVGIRNISLSWILYFLMVCLFVQASRAEKSLFSVDSHHGPITRAYAIEGTTLKDPVTISEELYGVGPTGVAVSEELGLMFMCYERSDIVTVFKCRTLLKVTDVDTDVSNLAGIAADDAKDKIYIIQRDTRNLYVYTWNEITETLNFESQEDLVGLPSPYKGTGIALDGDYLYVTDTSDTVRCFDTTNWEHQSDKDVTLPEDKGAWGIAIYHHHNLFDIRYGYFGGYVSNSHNNLIRVDLDDPNDYLIITPSSDSPVLGLAADPNTGLIYASVADHTNRVFDTSLNELFSIETNVTDSGPAGMAVGNRFYSPFKIEKSDDVDDNDCISPQMGKITYTLCYDYQWDEESDPDPYEFDSLAVIDYLPQGVDFVSASDDGSYDSDTQTVTWTISLDPFDANCVELTVQTNKSVIPGDEITNKAQISTTLTIDSKELDYSDSYEIDTPVCDCSEYGRIIHVDADVNVQEPNGATWDLAFGNLQEALAVTWPCDEVWVAEGTYRPTTNPNHSKASFGMINKVGVYGGFKGLEGGEIERWQRNWFNNETILNGYIDAVGGEPNNIDYVVVSDANVVNVFDGFTVKGGYIAGISCGSSSPLIAQHNKITDNWIGFYGPESQQPVIKNNWFYKNDYGLYFKSPTDIAVVRNNTIADNDEMGIYLEAGTEPAISNCIFSGHPEDCDLVGCYATYSYIEYPIVFDPNATPPDIGEGNIWGDPNYPPFVDGDKDDYRLDPCSICIDAGDPDGDYGAERDIDKHFRVLDGDGDGDQRVDMGADEYCNEGYDNDADFNLDDIVDELDLIEFAEVWLTDSDDPGWNDTYDLYADNVIDYIDFAYFAKEWLWMTCEKLQGYEIIEMMMGAGGGMDKMAGGESMLISEPADEQIKTTAEPSIEEQIEQIKYFLDWLYEIADQIDENIWLNLTTDLQEMLKELQQE